LFGNSRRRNASAAILGSIVIAACMVATVSLFGRSSNEVELESDGPAAIQDLVSEDGMKYRSCIVFHVFCMQSRGWEARLMLVGDEIRSLHVDQLCTKFAKGC
jgi:hypothetical protein